MNVFLFLKAIARRGFLNTESLSYYPSSEIMYFCMYLATSVHVFCVWHWHSTDVVHNILSINTHT